MKKNLPQTYENLLRLLDIDIDTDIIHEKVAHYFYKMGSFDKTVAMTRLNDYFEILKYERILESFSRKKDDFEYYGYKTKHLIQFMKGMGYFNNFINIVDRFEPLRSLEPFSINSE